MNTDNDIHALSGAYAVDALGDDERRRFEAHLAACTSCTTEVDSLREAAARLSATTATAPPERLRASVLDAITRVRPLPPLSTADPSPTPRPDAAEPPATAPEQDTATPAPVVELGEARRRRLRGVALVAAAAVVVAVGIGVGITRFDDDTNEQGDPSSQVADETQETIEAVLAAKDVRTAQPAAGAALPAGTSASVHWSEDVGRAVIVTANMPAAEPGTVYELWFEHDELMVPAGIMPRDGDTFLLEGDLQGASGIGITVEPEGGSPEPTSAPLALFPLESA